MVSEHCGRGSVAGAGPAPEGSLAGEGTAEAGHPGHGAACHRSCRGHLSSRRWKR